MRIVACMVLALLAAPSLAAPSAQTDDTPPVVQMSTPTRVGPAQFVVLRVTDAGSGIGTGTLAVNGTRIDVGDLAERGRVLFRARAGWEPGRLYRIRMTATDRSGNV